MSRFSQKPMVLTVHEGNFRAKVSTLPGRIIFRWCINQAQQVIAVSQEQQHRIQQEKIIAPVAVVYNMLNTATFPVEPQPQMIPKDHVRLLWVGGFQSDYYHRKGGEVLLRSIALAKSRLSIGIHLTLVGDGPMQDRARDLADQLGIADECEFVGALSSEQVREQMLNCHALVLASRSESFGVVLIEAMSCGRPVVATRCGGPDEIVTPETGILVEPENPEALVNGIVRLVETYATFDSNSIASYVLQKFGSEHITMLLNDIYTDVVCCWKDR
jgi:glycosyltransferase involved in cell wall biosynthesis